MFKIFKAFLVLFFLLAYPLQATFGYIAISREFYKPNHSVIITITDEESLEKTEIIVPFAQDTTTQFDDSFDKDYPQEDFIRIRFFSDLKWIRCSHIDIVANNLLEDDTFADQAHCSSLSLENQTEDQADEDDDFFEDSSFDEDELSHFNLTDLEKAEPMQLSTYDTVIVSMYALWAIQEAKIKNLYKNFTHWLQSKPHE